MSELGPLEAHADASRSHGPPKLGIVMSGGGARAAYQVGFLRCVARLFPELRIPYVTGVSAGAINAALIASHHGTFLQAIRELSQLWSDLTVEDVFKTDTWSLGKNAVRWLRQLASGGIGGHRLVRGLVDTYPLHSFLTEALHAVDGELTGVQYNIDHGRLSAMAISSTSYSSGQSTTWIQGDDVELWRRPQRKPVSTTMTVDHIMASAALPLFFPAVRVANGWYGDGGMRLVAPLSPAVHLGARRIIAISTRYAPTGPELVEQAVVGYPPPAQVMGILLNSIFLDLLDHDAVRLERFNQLIDGLPEGSRAGLRKVRLLTLRPSTDLAQMAGQFESQLPKAFRFLTRGLGTKETRSPDFLSMVLFQPDYLTALIELGERDAEARVEEIEAFLSSTDDD